MKKGYIRLIIVCLIFASIITFNMFKNTFNQFGLIAFLALTLGLSVYFLRYEKDNMRYKKDIMLIVVIFSFAYYLITYFFGIFTGFNRTPYSLEITTIIRNIAPVIMIIILSEMLRYMLVVKSNKYKWLLVSIALIFTALDLTLIIHTFDFNLADDVLLFLVMFLIPSISKNLLLTYLAYKVGYKAPIIYRLIFELPIFMVPIIPYFGIYVGSLLLLVKPAILAYIIYLTYDRLEYKEVVARPKNKAFNGALIVICIPLLIMILLTTNWFRIGAVTIGSGSMSPEIRRGDVVIVQHLRGNDIDYLVEGDVLVFKKADLIIVHRLVRIIDTGERRYFFTQGDANESEDGWALTEADILGRTNIRIRWIGLPTVWLNELLN